MLIKLCFCTIAIAIQDIIWKKHADATQRCTSVRKNWQRKETYIFVAVAQSVDAKTKIMHLSNNPYINNINVVKYTPNSSPERNSFTQM